MRILWVGQGGGGNRVTLTKSPAFWVPRALSGDNIFGSGVSGLGGDLSFDHERSHRIIQ